MDFATGAPFRLRPARFYGEGASDEDASGKNATGATDEACTPPEAPPKAGSAAMGFLWVFFALAALGGFLYYLHVVPPPAPVAMAEEGAGAGGEGGDDAAKDLYVQPLGSGVGDDEEQAQIA